MLHPSQETLIPLILVCFGDLVSGGLSSLEVWPQHAIKKSEKVYECDKFAVQQGSTKLLSLLSEITETSTSHGNFPCEFMHKKPNKCIFCHKQEFIKEKC